MKDLQLVIDCYYYYGDDTIEMKYTNRIPINEIIKNTKNFEERRDAINDYINRKNDEIKENGLKIYDPDTQIINKIIPHYYMTAMEISIEKKVEAN